MPSGCVLTARQVLADDLFMSKSPMKLIWHALYKLEVESVNHPPIYVSRLFNNYGGSASGDDFYVEGVITDKDFYFKSILYLFHQGKLFVVQKQYIEWNIDNSIYRAEIENPECTGNGIFRFPLSFRHASELKERVSNYKTISGGRVRIWWNYQYADFSVQPMSDHVIIDLSAL